MTQEQFEVRKQRAEREVFVITAAEEGWRVRPARNPSRFYLVSGNGASLQCTCPEGKFARRKPQHGAFAVAFRCHLVVQFLNSRGRSAGEQRMKIYLAGPLFTSAERSWNQMLSALLEEFGHEVYLPQAKEPGELNARAIFEADRKGIVGADVVVAIMDGPDPDSGTCWECGYAYGKKPIILVRTDFRRAGRAGLAPYNAMLTESADLHIELPFASVEDTARAIHKALASFNTPHS